MANTAKQNLKAAEARMKAAQDEYDRAKRELDAELALSPVKQLAIALHAKFCRHNHTDGCGWLYHIKDGVPTWSSQDQTCWLTKATAVARWAENHNVELDEIESLIGLL